MWEGRGQEVSFSSCKLESRVACESIELAILNQKEAERKRKAKE